MSWREAILLSIVAAHCAGFTLQGPPHEWHYPWLISADCGWHSYHKSPPYQRKVHVFGRGETRLAVLEQVVKELAEARRVKRSRAGKKVGED